MNRKGTILYYVHHKQLSWYGHMQCNEWKTTDYGNYMESTGQTITRSTQILMQTMTRKGFQVREWKKQAYINEVGSETFFNFC